MTTQARKADHVRICLDRQVEFEKSNGFERIQLEHKALPEVDFDEIDTSTTFLGKPFSAPIFIEAMTGGTPRSERINKNLAEAAQRLGIGMGLGSQRAMLERSKAARTYQVRDVAPDVLLLGNIGAAQISHYKLGDLISLVERVGADGLAVHLNPAQEVAQTEGDLSWADVLEHIKKLTRSVKFPVLAKEVGCGISGQVAKQLVAAGIEAIDIAGAGGTSWVKVDQYRSGKGVKPFLEWGIPTAEALRQCAQTVRVPLIASGGIRDGLEVAKALVLGASLAGLALPLLKPATQSWRAVVDKLEQLIFELKTAMFLLGVKNLFELRKVKYSLI